MHATKLNSYNDIELVSLYKETNDNIYVGELYQRYTHLIFGVCVKYLKDEDEAQDASMQLFEKLLIDLKKYEVKQFKGWLHIVCKTYCLMQLRSSGIKLKHTKEMHKDMSDFMESENELHLTYDIKEVQLTYMEECLKGLNEEQRICIELFFLQEKSYQQVTESTSFSMNNVKSHIQNGKRNLKSCIESKQ